MGEIDTTGYETKVRANIAYIWTIAAIILVGYTLWEYGHILAVLTLLIGFYTGVTSNVNSVYFGAPITAKKPDTNVSGDSSNVTVNNATNPNTPVT
jgi:hypothetical protein